MGDRLEKLKLFYSNCVIFFEGRKTGGKKSCYNSNRNKSSPSLFKLKIRNYSMGIVKSDLLYLSQNFIKIEIKELK